MVAFDRPPFKLLSRKFSKESVQAPSCERHKTTQRTPVPVICKQLLIPNNAIVSGCDTLLTFHIINLKVLSSEMDPAEIRLIR